MVLSLHFFKDAQFIALVRKNDMQGPGTIAGSLAMPYRKHCGAHPAVNLRGCDVGVFIFSHHYAH
jgi:hypothetical protein